MNWMLLPLRRYAEFTGRSRRKEYWLFALGLFLVYIVLGFIGAVMGSLTPSDGINGLLAGPAIIVLAIFALAVIVPSIAVQVRRFHDQDKSGWFVLLNLIPYLGGLIVLVFMCLEGTRGPNRFGADPKGLDIANASDLPRGF